MRRIYGILFIVIIFNFALVHAGNGNVTIYLFYGKGCPHCTHEKAFLEQLKKKYPIEVKSFEVWYNKENAKLFNEMCRAYGTTPKGVPTTFIGEHYIVGFRPETTSKEIEELVKECLEKGCINPYDKLRSVVTCVYVFIKGDCPQCQEILPFLHSIEKKYDVKIMIYNVNNASNKKLYTKVRELYNLPEVGYPIAFIGNKYFIGNRAIKENLENEVKICLKENCTCPIEKIRGITPYMPKPSEITPEEKSEVTLPIIGKIDTRKMSLALFTVIIAGLDGFNPCAMWVLMFLLTLLVYARSKKKILIVGGIFVFTSALVYFMFMAAWLNLFLILGYSDVIRLIIGIVAVVAGIINIKDFFFLGKGMSLSIPESKKPEIVKRMREITKETSSLSMIIATITLAIFVNFIELLCTAGLPAIYTRILTMRKLPMLTYYLYLALYNIVYVIPLATIVVIFALTLGRRRLAEKEGRILKGVSGALMLTLGILLILKPEALMFG